MVVTLPRRQAPLIGGPHALQRQRREARAAARDEQVLHKVVLGLESRIGEPDAGLAKGGEVSPHALAPIAGAVDVGGSNGTLAGGFEQFRGFHRSRRQIGPDIRAAHDRHGGAANPGLALVGRLRPSQRGSNNKGGAGGVSARTFWRWGRGLHEPDFGDGLRVKVLLGPHGLRAALCSLGIAELGNARRRDEAERRALGKARDDGRRRRVMHIDREGSPGRGRLLHADICRSAAEVQPEGVDRLPGWKHDLQACHRELRRIGNRVVRHIKEALVLGVVLLVLEADHPLVVPVW